jgi:hypothetical protein
MAEKAEADKKEGEEVAIAPLPDKARAMHHPKLNWFARTACILLIHKCNLLAG